MMKKLLLFAVAALMAGSMAAQKPGMAQARKVSRPHQIVKGQKQAFTKQLVRLGSQENLVQLETPKKVSTTSMRAVKSVTPAQVLAPRKVGELQQSYQGYGSNYQTKETTFWTMYSATAEDGTALLVDVIPVPDGWKEYFDYIPVEYTLNGNQITIDPQKIATGQSDDGTSYYYYIHSWASDDGKIVLTLNDDGSLTTIEDEDIAYSEFTEDNFDLSNDGPYNGLVLDIEKVKYYLEGETPTPNAGYEPEAIFLHPICVDGSYYSNLLVPACTDVTLINRSDMGDAYEWSLQQVEYNSATRNMDPVGDPITSTDKDFTFNTKRDNFSPAELVTSLAGKSSDVFTWNPNTWYAGGSESDWMESEDDDNPTMTKANVNGNLTVLNPSGVHSMILYQGKPSNAIYFTGVNLLIYQMKQTNKLKPVELYCKIYKAQRENNGRFTMGDLVAQADLSDIEYASWWEDNDVARLRWDNFYVEDELGLTEDVDFLNIDYEFAVVIEGWDNGTFTGRPMAMVSVAPTGLSSTYAIVSGAEEYTGAGWSFTGNVVLGFTGATYGYFYTEDETNINLPEEGGSAALKVEPYFCANDEEGNPTTALWLADDYELPEWLSIGITRESYTSDDWSFDLSVIAEPLPEGETYRTETVEFYQWGAKLTLVVTQGEEGVEPGFQPIPFDGADGKYYIANIASGLNWGSANDWGTRASLVEHPEYVTLLKQEDGTYQMESQVSNGGTNYYFGGDYMDGQPVNLTITATQILGYADDEETIPVYAYTIANGDNYFGWDGESTVLGKNLAADSENALWIIASEGEAIAALANATEEDPMDATFLILDPNFGRNNRNQNAWKMEASNQNLCGGSDINRCAESWQSVFTLSQKINVPNGKYILNAQAALTDYTNAYDGTDYPVIYANEATAPFNNMEEEDRGTNMTKLSESFSAGKYQVEPIEVIVYDGVLTVGAKGTRTDTWCIWDNFELEYYGPVDVDIQVFIDAYLKALAAANEAAGKQMSQAAKAALDAVIAANNNTDQNSVPDLTAATKALNEAVEAAQTSIRSYEILAAGVVADNSLENWTCTNTNTFHINTWSVEGNEGNDPSGMVTPFIENWVGKPGPLGEGQVFYTLAGIDPGEYNAQALVRVYSESGSEPAGATFFVGDDKVDIAAKGTNFEYNGMLGIYGVFGGTATVGDDGVLKFGVDIAAPTFNWVAIKNVKIGTGVYNGIQTVNAERQDSNGFFNLNGQKVLNPTKGLYINNGKKVVVK